LSCQTLLVSEAYLKEARTRADLAVLSEPEPLAFDAGGDLVSVF